MAFTLEELLEDNSRAVDSLRCEIRVKAKALKTVIENIENDVAEGESIGVAPLTSSNQHDIYLLVGELNARVLWKRALVNEGLVKDEDVSIQHRRLEE